MNIIQDDKGNYSSLRAILIVVVVMLIYFIYLFTMMVNYELKQESIDYTGLSVIFSVIFVEFLLVIFLKVKQKQIENK